MNVTHDFRVLLVEDNTACLALTVEILEKLGCHVTRATCGTNAIEIVDSSHDFVLMKIELPEINGIQTARKIWEKIENLPIIAYTTQPSEEDIDYFMMQGMVTVISKPATASDFQEFLASYARSLEDV